MLTGLAQFQAARLDVHRQFAVVIQIRVVHLIEHRDVLHQLYLVAGQRFGNLIDVYLNLVVAALHKIDLRLRLAEHAEEAARLLVGEALELYDELAHQIARLAQILSAHLFERAFAELGDLALSRRAVAQHQAGVGDVYAAGEVLDHLLLLGRELHLRNLSFGGGRGGYLRFLAGQRERGHRGRGLLAEVQRGRGFGHRGLCSLELCFGFLGGLLSGFVSGQNQIEIRHLCVPPKDLYQLIKVPGPRTV